MDVESGSYESHTSDGLTVSSNNETADDIKTNFESEAKPLDGEAPDPEKEEADAVTKAAAKLGEKGGKAAAEKRAAEAKDAKEAKAEEVKKDKKGDPRHDPKARVEEATRESAELKRELKRERDERARERAELNARLERIERGGNDDQGAQAEQRHADEKPLEKDFDEYAEFVEARARWAARQENAEMQRKTEAHLRAAAYADSVRKTNDKFIEAAQQAQVMDRVHPGLLTKLVPTWTLEANVRPGPLNIIADEVVASEYGPALLLHFTENPQEFQRIATLRTPRDISREMAKLETRLDAVTAGTSIQGVASKAKPPVRPVTGSPNAADPDEVGEDLAFEDHFRRMNQRDFKAKRSAFGR